MIAQLLFPSACVQRYSKKLSDKQVTELLRATCQKPHERMGEIQKVKQRLSFALPSFRHASINVIIPIQFA
jgi:hypothetical protein